MKNLFPHTASDTRVAVARCHTYRRRPLKDFIERAAAALCLQPMRNRRILIKPNCISAGPHGNLACTHPEFIASCVEWLVDQGAHVTIGDSPAFGSGQAVMEKTGITAALTGLPVHFASFHKGKNVRLAGGVKVCVANEVLEAEFLVNLPKLKAHSQLGMTMGVKNLFGTVIGLQKPLLHMRYGRDGSFVEMLVDLLAVLPDGVTICDGVVAMERDGPLGGEPAATGLVAMARNPVALDTALLQILGIVPDESPIWRHCFTRNISGSDPESLVFPMCSPVDCEGISFSPPGTLKPIVFQPHRALFSLCRRLVLKCVHR